MRWSRYNNYIRLSNNSILGYNAFSRRFMIIPKGLDISTQTDSILQSISEEQILKLREAGFIIENNIDELTALYQDINRTDFNESYCELHINPTLDCNFKCWYCYENHVPNSRIERDTLLSVKKYLSDRLCPPIKNFQLAFFGGEPLIAFHECCVELIEHARECCSKHNISFATHFTTNGYLLTQDIVRYLSDLHCSLQITLDGHRQFHDKVRRPNINEGSYDRILDNVALAAGSGIRIILRINYTFGNISSVVKIVDDLDIIPPADRHNVSVDFQRVWQDSRNGQDDYINDFITKASVKLSQLGFRYSMPSLRNPRTQSCYGDKNNHLLVNYNGDVYRCTARDFLKENRVGVLNEDGSVKWEEGYLSHWNSCKFSLPICHNCRIAPLCLGGCRQRGLEAENNDVCPLGFDENKKDEMILQRFEFQYMK